MKWSHTRREPVRYGLTPSAFPELWLALIVVLAFAVSWLIRVVPVWLGF